MQFIDILIALLPALFWGSVVLINVFVGGGPYNQIRGTTLGALIVGIVLLLIGKAKFDINYCWFNFRCFVGLWTRQPITFN